jgi:hypothetical protein
MATMAELTTQANMLAEAEALVATNEGTYGDADVRRAGAAGGMSDYRVFERVGGGRRPRGGCGPARAPGRAREFRQEIAGKRAELADLRKRIGRVQS